MANTVSENTRELLSTWQEVVVRIRWRKADGASRNEKHLDYYIKLLWALTHVPEDCIRALAVTLNQTILNKKSAVERDEAEQLLFIA